MYLYAYAYIGSDVYLYGVLISFPFIVPIPIQIDKSQLPKIYFTFINDTSVDPSLIVQGGSG